MPRINVFISIYYSEKYRCRYSFKSSIVKVLAHKPKYTYILLINYGAFEKFNNTNDQNNKILFYWFSWKL